MATCTVNSVSNNLCFSKLYSAHYYYYIQDYVKSSQVVLLQPFGQKTK